MNNNYAYILMCSDNTLYTGWTNDLDNRVAAHNAGIGAKYTKARLPVKLIHSEAFNTKSEALKREHEIKSMRREEKLKIIERMQNQNVT
jgi:putative endonuclease